LGAIQIVVHVIANPQGEATHAGTLDCSTTFDDDEASFPSPGMKQSPSTLKERFALLRTSQLLLMTIAVTPSVIANPQGEATQHTRTDCFTLRDDGAAGRLHKSFRAAEMQCLFPNDDTGSPFCDNLNCLGNFVRHFKDSGDMRRMLLCRARYRQSAEVGCCI
jgi:hypothetical protein